MPAHDLSLALSHSCPSHCPQGSIYKDPMSGLYRLMVKLSDQLITQKRALAAEAAAKLGGDGRSMGSLLRVGPSGAGGSLASRPELKTVSEEAAA